MNHPIPPDSKYRSVAGAALLGLALAGMLLSGSFSAGYCIGYLSGWEKATEEDVLSLNIGFMQQSRP